MARHIPDAAYDAYFAYFSACTRIDLVSDSSTPTNLTNTLANETIDSGDFSTGAGTPTGRRLTIAAQPGVAVTANGTTRHAILSLGGTIRLVTVCNERVVSVTDGDLVNMGSFYLQVAAPTAPA